MFVIKVNFSKYLHKKTRNLMNAMKLSQINSNKCRLNFFGKGKRSWATPNERNYFLLFVLVAMPSELKNVWSWIPNYLTLIKMFTLIEFSFLLFSKIFIDSPNECFVHSYVVKQVIEMVMWWLLCWGFYVVII